MDIRKAQQAIEQVARNHGITPGEVSREIEAALACARENPATRPQWQTLTGGRDIRTAEEFIALFTKP